MKESSKQIAAISLTLILFTLFFLDDIDLNASRSLLNFWDTGHIVFFALATYLVLSHSVFFANKPLRFQFFWLLIFSLLIGVFIELVQSEIGRSQSISDLRKNITGTFIGIFFFSTAKIQVEKYKLKIIQFLVFILLLFEIAPLAAALLDEWTARKQFPVLADFESSLEVSRWVGNADFNIVPGQDGANNHLLEVHYGTSEYSSVFFKYFPRNWEGFSSLQFTAFNPSSAELQITCRIHDKQHNNSYNDRFNRSYLLKPGKNSISIPMEDIMNAPAARKMDIRQISEVGFFVARQKSENIIYLDDIMLL